MQRKKPLRGEQASASREIKRQQDRVEQRELSPLSKKDEKLVLRQAQIAIRLMLIRNESFKG